jgi:hypothetical protein
VTSVGITVERKEGKVSDAGVKPKYREFTLVYLVFTKLP